jgi:hypothetical protein
LGELGIVQSVKVTPFWSCSPAALPDAAFLEPLSVAAAARHEGGGGQHERDRRRDDREPLGHGLLLLRDSTKTFLDLGVKTAGAIGGGVTS